MIEVVAFDGDDTLWHNESVFNVTQDRFRALMLPYVEEHDLDEQLLVVQMRNLELFGYGVKSFTLSMIETAIELSAGRVTGAEVQRIIEAGRAMLQHPVELLYGVADAVDAVSETHPVMLITKGDLFDQESKLARSGLGDRFERVEIVARKDEPTYERVLRRHELDPSRFVMVGNSPRSDIAPVLALGGWAVHVPYPLTWAHEEDVDSDLLVAHPRYRSIASLDELPALLAGIEDER